MALSYGSPESYPNQKFSNVIFKEGVVCVCVCIAVQLQFTLSC